MDVRHMRQILAIHRHGSLVKAAQELGVAQPTLSKSLARLEDELGVKLFHRSGAGARATPFGVIVAERARRIIDDAAQLNREIELTAGGLAGEVRIGVGAAVSAVFVPQVAAAVVRRFPRLRLRTVTGPRADQLAALEAGHADMLIGAIEVDLDELDLHVTPLLRDRLVAVASPDHPLAAAGPITAADYVRHPTSTASLSPFLSVETVLGLKGEDAVFLALAANEFVAILHLARQGLVTSIGPAHIYSEDIARGVLVELDLPIRRDLTVAAIMTRPAALSPILGQIAVLACEVADELGIGLGA